MSSPPRPSEEQREYSLAAVALLFAAPAIGGALFGYDIGATSYAITQLSQEDLSGTQWWKSVQNSAALTGIIVSAGSLGAFLGSWGIFYIANAVGRRWELRLGAVLYCTGALLEITGTLSLLLVGRLIYGLAIGVTMHGAPTYLAEMGPPDIRGLLVSLKEAAIVLGILLGYVLGYAFHVKVGGWKSMYACSVVGAVTMFGLSFAIPRSYRWLLLRKKHQEALESVQFLYRDNHVAERVLEQTKLSHERAMEAVGDDNHEQQEHTSIWDEAYRGPMVAAVGLVVLQQVTGQPSVLSYAAPIFQQAMLSDYASVLVAVFKLVATLSAAATVEKFGRKNLLYAGCSLMLLALVLLSISFGMSSMSTAILLAMFLYIGGYQFSFGPITWLIISEVFPLNVRGQAVAFSVQMNFFLNAIVQFGVPVLEKLVGLNLTFGIFAMLTAYSIYFVRIYVIETKGLTLEEIELAFQERARRRSSDRAAEMQSLVEAEAS